MLRIEASKTHLCKHTKMSLMNILSLFQISAPLEHPCFTCHVNVCMCVFLSAPQTLFTNMWGAVLHSDYDNHKILIARTACRVTINRFMICYHMWYDMIWFEMMMIWSDLIIYEILKPPGQSPACRMGQSTGEGRFDPLRCSGFWFCRFIFEVQSLFNAIWRCLKCPFWFINGACKH